MEKLFLLQFNRFPFGVINKVISVFIYYLKLIMESLDEIQTIIEKRSVVQSILNLIYENPDHAGEIYSDLTQRVALDVRYFMLQQFKHYLSHTAGDSSGGIKREDIPEIYMDILKCWCCDKALNECLTLQEEGWTYTKHESNPYIFDRAREMGLTRLDENGNEFIYTCGLSYT